MRTVQIAFQDLIDGLEVSHDEAGLASVADRTAKRLGFRWFAYLSSTQHDTAIISSYPKDWVRHYQAEELQRIDPVVRPAHWPNRAFSWTGDSRYWRDAAQRRFFGEAGNFRIRCGVTVPIRTGGNSFAAFTLAAEEQSEDFARYIDEAVDTLQLMGLYFHTHVYGKMRLGLGRVDDAPLTLRETQCLAWAARGKTMADTAQILGIAKRTVEFHLDNARAKLDALTVSHAVAEAIRREFLPRS